MKSPGANFPQMRTTLEELIAKSVLTNKPCVDGEFECTMCDGLGLITVDNSEFQCLLCGGGSAITWRQLNEWIRKHKGDVHPKENP